MTSPVFRHERIVAESEDGSRLDFFLLGFPYAEFRAGLSPSRSTIQKWIADGHVGVNGEVAYAKSRRLRRGDVVALEVEIPEQPKIPPAEPLDIRIVHQDPSFVVIDKPPGIISHPARNAMTGTVINFLRYKGIPLPPTGNPFRPGIVHRLDKNTSGLMVVACTDAATAALIGLIKKREVRRSYLAIVYGNPPMDNATIEAAVGRHEVDRRKMTVSQDPDAKPARTHYAVLTRYPGFSLLACKLDTGRTHQIRVHMSHIGYPVVGDPLYGGRRAPDRIVRLLKRLPRQNLDVPYVRRILNQIAEVITADQVHLLHAAKLTFPHPVTGRILTFTSEPHAKFLRVLGLLESLPHQDTGNAL
jgi:23S rRNA pseudouridine1911/1915/1917 synthase